MNNAAQELSLPLNYVDSPRPAGPAVQVFLADGVTAVGNTELYAGDTIVVRGSGFDPAANAATRAPLTAGDPAGNYIAFGNFAPTWRPSTPGTTSNDRVIAVQRWAMADATFGNIGDRYIKAVRDQREALTPDGTFEFSIELADIPSDKTAPAGGSYGLFTYVAGGATNDPAQEFELRLNYQGARPATPEPSEDQPAEGGLHWAFHESWAAYVTGVAQGSIVVSGGATLGAANTVGFQQVSSSYSADTQRGSIAYRGTVNYVSSAHGFNIALKDPRITFAPGAATMTAEVSTGDTAGTSSMARVVVATLSGSAPVAGAHGTLTWSGVTGVFADTLRPETWHSEYAGKATAPITFTLGENAAGEVDPESPVIPPVTPPATTPPPAPATPAQAAGSLNWGVSSGFAAYTTGGIAKGTVTTTGVGVHASSYTFPQATGGSWNAATQTGTVHYSGVVAFSGHGGLMRETFANPVITVSDGVSGTISAGGHTFILNLAGAGKTVGAGGEVTFSGVSVIGAINGGGSSGAGTGGGTFAVDPLSFTVGATNTVNYGSTQTSNPSLNRRAAAAPPAVQGVTVVTSDDQLVAGGEIEITAAGFEPGESGILVVIYSEPTVLDTNARADANGVVRWIGTLPDGLSGEHTITLQGSINAGKVVRIQTQQEFAAAQSAQVGHGAATARTMAAESERLEAAGAAPGGGEAVWMWWAGALALVLVAGALTAVVVARRRSSQN